VHANVSSLRRMQIMARVTLITPSPLNPLASLCN
jgi:hypothetical protein